MTRMTCIALLGITAALQGPAALAQYPSEVMGFNSEPYSDPNTSEEMFRDPGWNSVTSEYVLPNPAGQHTNHASFRASGLQTEGPACLEMFFRWVNPFDPEAWVRVSTFAGVDHPNPALHTGGKVRFNINNRSQMGPGDVGICLGIRETGANVPQMGDGGTVGPIEWVGVDTEYNGIIAGPDGIVDTEADGDDIQVYPVGYDIINDPAEPLPLGTAVIAPGSNGDIDTAKTGDDDYRYGYIITASGERKPIPALILPQENNYQELEFDLATGQITHRWDHDNQPSTPYQTDIYETGVAGFTGNGVLDVDRGTLEHVAFVNDVNDVAVVIDVGIDVLQFEAPEADPVLPPRVVSPIIAGETEVTITDLQYGVQSVWLYEGGDFVDMETVSNTDDVIFTIDEAVENDVYTATQIVNGEPSGPSPGVRVLPSASPYTFSVIVDDDGDGSCTTNYEFVPVTAVDGTSERPAPRGLDIYNSDGIWQTVDIPLDDNNLVIGWYGGDGSLDPSPDDVWSIDTLWFTNITGAETTGPHEVLIDSVEALDGGGATLVKLHDMENGVNYLQNARTHSTTSPAVTELTGDGSYDGVTSHRLTWTYPSLDDDETLGMYHNIGFACGTAPGFPDTAVTLRFRLCSREYSENPVPLPAVEGPIAGDQDTFLVTHDESATALQLYINGATRGDPVGVTGTETEFAGVALEAGDSISVVQTLAAGDSDLAYPRGVTAAPLPPIVTAPVAPGADAVEVTGLWAYDYATADVVTVYVNGDPHGDAVPSGPTAVVELDTEIYTNDVITASQQVNGAESPESRPVTVLFTAPVIYKAPAEGDTSITLLGLTSTTEEAAIVIGASEYTAVPEPGADRVDVQTPALSEGQILYGYYTAAGIDSVASETETVTIGAVSEVIVCDDFEYDEAAYQAAWLDSGSPRLELSDDFNATDPAGLHSLLGPAVSSRVEQPVSPTVTPSATAPVVLNVHIYDAYGPGAIVNQFAQLNGHADWFFFFIGLYSSYSGSDEDYYQCRVNGNGGPDWINLDEYDAPVRSVGWHTFTAVLKGEYLDVYVDGLLSRKNIGPIAPPILDKARIGPGAGVASTLEAWYDDYCVEIGPVRFEPIGPQPPRRPDIDAPIQDGDEIVSVSNLEDSLVSVEIYDATPTQIGIFNGPFDETGVAEVELTRPMVHLESLTAVATNAIGQTESYPLEVGKGPGDVLICIGVRETGDTGALGTEGSTHWSYDIEWVGATGVINSTPLGTPVSPSDEWQTLTFNPAGVLIEGMTGDGTIDGERGVLEHLAVTVDAASTDRSAGSYRLYIDNVVNVEAGDGGEDLVIADFEDVDVGVETLFQEPTNSGSTSIHLKSLPSASEASDLQGYPGQSELLVWYWKDTDEERWARITTESVEDTPSPIIDLTKPIRMDVLLVINEEFGCPNPGAAGVYCYADIQGDDCVVNLNDLAKLVGGYGTTTGAVHDDGDLDGDGDIDLSDLAALLGMYGDDCN